MVSRFASLAFSLVVLLPAIAFAQEAGGATSEESVTAPTSPQTRVDVSLPSIGLGGVTADSGVALTGSVEVTVMHRSGHGARVQVGFLDTGGWQGGLLGPTPAHASELLLDASYAHRIRLVGDDRLGLGLDLFGGASVANIHFNQATTGFCWSSCSQPPDVAETTADGWHVGANVGASLDFRASVFVMGLDVRAHTMLALEQDEPGEQPIQADLSASIYVGFGFY